jgi:hypothetical protein
MGFNSVAQGLSRNASELQTGGSRFETRPDHEMSSPNWEIKYKRFSHWSVVNRPRMTIFLLCYVGYVSTVVGGGPFDELGEPQLGDNFGKSPCLYRKRNVR